MPDWPQQALFTAASAPRAAPLRILDFAARGRLSAHDLHVEPAAPGLSPADAIGRAGPAALLLDAAGQRFEAAAAAAGDLPTLVLVDEASAEAGGAALPLPNAAFAPRDVGDDALADLLRALADVSGLAERGGSFAPAARAAIAAPAAALDAAAAPAIRRLIRARRERERHLPADLFGEPVWDMLLDLAASELEGRRVCVSSLCIAAAAPTTTALRWIKRLCDEQLLERAPDPDDRRRYWLHLRPHTRCAVAHSLRAILPPA